MTNVALVLGPVAFAGFEIPSRIDFGGTQRLAVHDLPGGARVIDVLGPAPSDIAWSGIFSGADATARAQTLDALRVSAATLTLSWDVFLFSVLIRGFAAEYANTAWVPYRLSCAVLQDQTQAFATVLDTLIGTVAGDVASAAGFTDLGGVDLSALQTGLAASGAGGTGTGAYAAAGATLSGALEQAVGGRDAAGSALQGYGANLAPGSVGAMIGQAGQAATLGVGAAYLSRATANFADAGG